MRCKNSYNIPGIGDVLFIKRSGVRRLRISVSPRNGVVVTIPARLPVSAAMAFVVEKREWILRALRRQSERIRKSVENGKIAGVPSDPSELERMRETARAIEAGLYSVPKGFTSTSMPASRILLPIPSVKQLPMSTAGSSGETCTPDLDSFISVVNFKAYGFS